MKTYGVLFALAFLASYLGTPAARRLWARLGLLDSAITAGPHQRRPVPRLGGVIIYLALLGTLLTLFFPSNVITEEFRAQWPTLWLLWGPATFILLVGIADDVRGMSAWVKFSAQLTAALWLVSTGVRISHLSLPWGHTAELGVLSIGVTLLWLVGVTNAFNLIDGLDGLAAGVAFLAASAIAVTAMMLNNTMVVVITVALAGALLGFLRHNFSPATIFLGDSGSLFVGFVLAASAVVWHQKATTAVAVAAPLLAFALPVTETAVSILRRYLRGQPLFVSDRRHIHHRLLALGLTPRRTVLLLYAASAVAALGCILVARGHNMLTGVVLLLYGAACWFGVRRLAYPEFAEIARAFSRQRVAARLQLEEKLNEVRKASTGIELWRGLQALADALELDELDLEITPERRASLNFPPDGQPDGAVSLWRLTVPLDSGSSLTLGRDPLRSSTALSLEMLAKELGAVVEETLSRLEEAGSTPTAVEGEIRPGRRWAPTPESAD